MIIIDILALITYLLTWILIYQRLKLRLQESTVSISHYSVKIAWLLALLLHAVLLFSELFKTGSLDLDFVHALQHVAWWLSLLLLIMTIKRSLETLGLFALPIAMISLLLGLLPVSGNSGVISLSSALGIHIFTSFLAYGMILLATMQALLLAFQSRNLHQHHAGGIVKTLPPMQDMEHLLFSLIRFGVLLLTLSLLTGFLFMDGFFHQQVAHKIVLSIVAWFVFSALLLGHWVYGWRGKIAVRWVISGFVLLMLAYFGSKFVIEYLVV